MVPVVAHDTHAQDRELREVDRYDYEEENLGDVQRGREALMPLDLPLYPLGLRHRIPGDGHLPDDVDGIHGHAPTSFFTV